MLYKILSAISLDPDLLEIPKPGNPGESTMTLILSYVFAIAGGVAMIVIIIAGMQFVLSRGDPQKAANSRNTIIYAGVGLALAAAAFSLVRYIVGALS